MDINIDKAKAEQIAKDLAKPYVDKIAEAIAEDARASCPVDTGELRDSIEIGRDGDTVTVSATAGHALVVEFGSKHTAAQPFLRPALYQKR